MLIVVEYRNFHPVAQLAFDVEAFWSLDILQVDSTKGWFQTGDDLDQLVGVTFTDFNVEYVNAGELLEQYPLAFHNRFCCEWADVAQAENRSTVGDNRH